MLERKGGSGGGRLKRGTHCTVDGTLSICPVGGGEPLTVCILHERSKNPCCHAGVGFQVVTVDLVGGIAFHLMRGTGIDCRCSSTSTYVWGQ